MKAGENIDSTSIADAGETGATDQPNSDEVKAKARQDRLRALTLLALIPIICNIIAIPGLGITVTGWGKLNASLFQLASILINPATAVLGMMLATRFVDTGSKRLARVGGSH